MSLVEGGVEAVARLAQRGPNTQLPTRPQFKTCTRCNETFDCTRFSKDRTRRDGLASWCKGCRRSTTDAWAIRTKDARKVTRKAWYERNSERLNELSRKSYHANRDKRAESRKRRRLTIKNARLRRDYGITLQEQAQMLHLQGGMCAICGSSTPRHSNGQWHTDHDHTTGKVRGILCSRCNVGLGMFNDNPDIAEKAAMYLRSSNVII